MKLLVEFIEEIKICQPIQIWLSLKNQIWLNQISIAKNRILQMSILLKWIFLLLKQKKLLSTYKKHLSKL